MSELRIDSTATLDLLVARLRGAARQRGVRALLVLPGTPVSTDTGLAAWARRSRFTCGVGTGKRSTDASDRLLATLGHENGDLFWSAPADVRPSEIAAVLGTLRAGSLAIVRLPSDALRRSPSLQRLRREAHRAGCVAAGSIVERQTILWATLGRRFDRDARRQRAAPSLSAPRTRPGTRAGLVSVKAVRAQDADLVRALACLRRGPDSCVVMIGPRGTGKSRLLGRIATALAIENASTHHDRDSLPLAICSAATTPAVTLLLAAPTVRFVGVQTAMAEHGCTLLVDEAANLPLASLTTLLQQHERVVLATTVDGYEMAGHAFAGRFLDHLGQLRPGWCRLATTTHFRYPSDDPVSRLLNVAFLLDVARHDEPMSAHGSRPDIVLQRLIPATLGQQPQLLRRTVALLMSTHYRSALDDLDALLRGSFETVVARDGEQVVGVVCVAREGALPSALGEAVLAGRRRLPDQLLPQRLARAADDASALGERYRRVIRIAVVAQRRREGIARQLVEHLVREAGPNVALGASFARGEAADRFWASLGAEVFHDGVRVNPRSGERSRAVLIGGSAATRKVLYRAVSIHVDNICPSHETCATVDDAGLLQRFVAGQRGWRDCRGALIRSWNRLTPAGAPALEASRTYLGLPPDAGERRWERTLADWFRRRSCGA